MFMFIVRFCKHIQSIYVFFGDSQNPDDSSDKFIIVSLYFYRVKFILFPILAAQGRRNGFGIKGGGQKKCCRANFFYITLTYKRDIIFFISISVIHWAISLFYPYLYTLIYISLFLKS